MASPVLIPENPLTVTPLRPGGDPNSAQGAGAVERERELQRIEGMKIEQTAIRAIGMFTKEIGGRSTNLPNSALAVSLLFTRATSQRIMLGTEPHHVLSTSLLYNSLLHDSRFIQMPLSCATPGDIVVQSGLNPAGYAGIVVDQGRIISDSSKGVQNDSSLEEIEHRIPRMSLFRYIGVQKSPGYSVNLLANVNFNSNEPRLPAGQPGGGQWTSGMAPSTMAVSGRDSRISSVAATKSVEFDRSHDNSGGNPGVLIYTNNKDTYNRYTTIQSKYGQLAGAKVIYVASPDSPNNAFLATGDPVNVSPSSNNVTY